MIKNALIVFLYPLRHQFQLPVVHQKATEVIKGSAYLLILLIIEYHRISKKSYGFLFSLLRLRNVDRLVYEFCNVIYRF